MTRDPNAILDQARLLLDRPDPDQRAHLKSELEWVYTEYSGTGNALKALQLLNQMEVREKRMNANMEGQTRQLVNEGMLLKDARDARLIPYLEKVARLNDHDLQGLELVFSQFKTWFDRHLHDLEAREDRDLLPLETLAAHLRRLNGLSMELLHTLDRFQEGLFLRLFRIKAPAVEAALLDWDIPGAWKIFGEIEDAPEYHQKLVRDLRSLILRVGDQVKKAETLKVHTFPKKINWGEVRLEVETWQDFTQILEIDGMPAEWQEILIEKQKTIETRVLVFLRNQARKARTPNDLLEFQESFARLSAQGLPQQFAPRPEWFEKSLAKIEHELQRAVREAETPQALSDAILEIQPILDLLPPSVNGELGTVLVSLQTLYELWTQLRMGREVDEIESIVQRTGDVTPKALRQEMAIFNGWMVEVSALKEMLRQESTAQEAVQKSLSLTKEILAQCPDHEEAQTLNLMVNNHQQKKQADDALRDLDITRFVEILSQSNLEHPYRELANHLATLCELRELAETEVIFQDLESSKKWAMHWRRVLSGLPADFPDSLGERIIALRIDRKVRWHKALEQVLSKEHNPDRLRMWVAFIKEFSEEFRLLDFLKQFERRELVVTIRQCMEAQKWDEVEPLLSRLSPTDPEYSLLQSDFRLAWAQSEGLITLADELFNAWSLHAKNQNKNDLLGLLQTAIQNAWRDKAASALDKLIFVFERAQQEGFIPKTWEEKLEMSSECVKLEASLNKGTLAASDLTRLYQRFRESKDQPFFKEWLLRLLLIWRDDPKFLIHSIWAMTAFKGFDESGIWDSRETPLKRLESRTKSIAESVLAGMRDADKLVYPAVVSQVAQLKGEEKVWQQLNGFLETLSKQVAFPQPPEQLGEALGHLDAFQHALEELAFFEGADLRDPNATFRLQNLFSRLGHLKSQGFRAAEGLRDMVERLQELKGRTYYHDQILKLGQRCGDLNRVDEEQLFTELARIIEEQHKYFNDKRGTHLKFWNLLTRECILRIPLEAGLLNELDGPEDISGLISLCSEAQKNEDLFRRQIDKIRREEPPGYDINPDLHRDFFHLFPREPPASRRAYYLFHRHGQREDTRRKLVQGRDFLPGWVNHYLERGLPWS